MLRKLSLNGGMMNNKAALAMSPAKTSQKILPFRLSSRLKSGELVTIIFFLLPALILFTYFVILPLVGASEYAFYRWNGFGDGPTRWVGTSNFERMATNKIVISSFKNTIYVTLIAVFIQIPLGMLMALYLADKKWANSIFRLIFFLPFILSEIATGLIWSFIFDGDYGVSAMITASLEIEKIFPLADKTFAFPLLMFVFVWKYFGIHMMIFIAALQAIPNEVVESATIDGAKPGQIARYIKIPMIKPAIAVAVFIGIIGSLQIFDLIIPMTNGGPSNSTHSLVSYIYNYGLSRNRIGFGSAVGLVLFAVSFIVALVYRRLTKNMEKL